jgi:hypothetical protein
MRTDDEDVLSIVRLLRRAIEAVEALGQRIDEQAARIVKLEAVVGSGDTPSAGNGAQGDPATGRASPGMKHPAGGTFSDPVAREEWLAQNLASLNHVDFVSAGFHRQTIENACKRIAELEAENAKLQGGSARAMRRIIERIAHPGDGQSWVSRRIVDLHMGRIDYLDAELRAVALD